MIQGRFRELCARARGGLVASGTATLEAALSGLPHVIAYRTDRLTAAVAKRVLLTDHVGLPNIVANQRILPEVLQDQLSPQRLAHHLLRQWSEGPVRAAVTAGLALTRERLGAGGAIGRITRIIDAELDRGLRRNTHGMRSHTEMA